MEFFWNPREFLSFSFYEFLTINKEKTKKTFIRKQISIHPLKEILDI